MSAFKVFHGCVDGAGHDPKNDRNTLDDAKAHAKALQDEADSRGNEYHYRFSVYDVAACRFVHQTRSRVLTCSDVVDWFAAHRLGNRISVAFADGTKMTGVYGQQSAFRPLIKPDSGPERVINPFEDHIIGLTLE